jgi:pyruvate kinase
MTARAESLVPNARVALKDKTFTNARYLARKLTITPALAGQVLSAMDEWSKPTRARRRWIREAS